MPTIIIWSFAKANNKWVTNFNKGKKNKSFQKDKRIYMFMMYKMLNANTYAVGIY